MRLLPWILLMYSGLALSPLRAEPTPLLGPETSARLRPPRGPPPAAPPPPPPRPRPPPPPRPPRRPPPLRPSTPAYLLRLTATNPQPVRKGDTLWVHFFLRTESSPKESGEGLVEFIFEDRAKYDKSAKFEAIATGAWEEFALPFKARADYAPGEADLILRIGMQPQVVEIARLRVLNYGPATDRATLPKLGLEPRYAGSEPDAPWRRAAAERIERHRKAPLTIRVVDPQGRPVPGAQIRVRQTAHAYGFGTAVSAALLADPDPANPAVRGYRDFLKSHFNLVTFENDLKWRQWEADPATPLAAAQWARANGLQIRGHTMVWPGWRKLPPRVRDLEGDPAALRELVLRHIRDIGTRTSDTVDLWDVLNEPYTNHDLTDLLGHSSLTEWFQAARQAAPGARLYINDYGIINGRDPRHADHYERTIRTLLESGAPLQGIGIQGHFGDSPSDPEAILATLDRFAQFRLPLQMTEFSLDIEDPAFCAQYLRDLMTVFFSHPATNAFTLWTFAEGTGFAHQAKLIDKSGRLTPAGQTWQTLTQREWRTETTVTTTTPDGTAHLRAFQGTYTLETPGRPPKTITLPPEGLEITL